MYKEISKKVGDNPKHSGKSVIWGTIQKRAQLMTNNTGLPNNLKSGVESLSGLSMNDVKVHFNSSRPAQLHALAYTQGTDIHVAPGQEKHLPHEAWHVVQQMQWRVRPTMKMNGVEVNDDPALEREADLMGEKAAHANYQSSRTPVNSDLNYSTAQFKWDSNKYKTATDKREVIEKHLKKIGYTGVDFNKLIWLDISGYIEKHIKCVSSDEDVALLCDEYIKKNNLTPQERTSNDYYDIIASGHVNEDGRLTKSGMEKIKTFPTKFKGISLFRGDEREDFASLPITTADTRNFNSMSDEAKKSSITAASELQAAVYKEVMNLDEKNLRTYMFTWQYPNSPELKVTIDGREVSTTRPDGHRFNGIATYPNSSSGHGIEYKIDLSSIEFELKNPDIARKAGVAFYEGSGIKLQIFKNGEIDIMSFIPQGSVRIERVS